MEFVKNNILSLICALFVLIALVVPFYPMSGYKQELESKLSERVGVYQSLNDLRTKSRNLPVVNPDNANPVPLEGFPTQEVITKGQAVKASFEKMSKGIMDEAIKANKHQPLVPNVLPKPTSASSVFSFRDQYNEMMAFPMPPINNQPATPPGGICKFLKVGVPPTMEQIKLAQDTLYRTRYAPQLGNTLPGGGGSQLDLARNALTAEFNAEALKVPAQERQLVADRSLIYMNADTLPYDPTFRNREAPTPEAVWFAQLDLWIIEDICKAILECDGPAKNVTEAPVKHFVKLNIPRPMPYVIAPGQTLDGELTGPAPKVYDIPNMMNSGQNAIALTTGRVSNPLYDVVQFDLVVNVEADQAPRFIQTLSKNRFITVVQASVTAKDSGALQQAGFMYGPKPVVELNLKCEEIFFHKWSRELMPEVVAKLMTGAQTGTSMEGGPGPAY